MKTQIIKNKKLPKALKLFIEDQKRVDGDIELNYNNIVNCVISDKIITECLYRENGIELEWFSKDNNFYIFIDSVNLCYYTEDEGLVYI